MTHVRKTGDQNMNSLHIKLHMYLLALRFHRYPKGGAGFESAIWGWLVSPAGRLLNFFFFMYQFWVIYGPDELRLGCCAL
jgi:hypothetical protein